MNTSLNNKQISLTSQVRYRTVGDDGVLVHLENGRVIVVNEVGLFIVQQLNSPKTRQELAVAISHEFEVTENQAESDLEVYLAELDNEQVLEHAS
jgi:hypothetical protein